MRAVSIGAMTLHLDPPEAGRYNAKLLIFSGLFQSYDCWRPFTSTLAHRGWEVFFLSRQGPGKGRPSGPDLSLRSAIEAGVEAADRLGENLILLGADLGALLALEVCNRRRPMALALFAPCEAGYTNRRLEKQLGFLERRRLHSGNELLPVPQALARHCASKTYLAAEPRTWIREFTSSSPPQPNTELPPAIVFAPSGDVLVETDHALSFADGRFARASSQLLRGRWWPAMQGTSVADEVHRFLILTLADRIVDFPDDLIQEDSE